jgi:N-acetylmuramoyl-L-alanine amidase
MRRAVIALIMALGLTGCAPEERMPEVVYDYGSTTPTAPLPVPAPVRPTTPIVTPPITTTAPRAWIPSRYERAWTAIVIHHSATDKGDATIIDKWHRENNGWNGIGYDFVIGNGTSSGDGEVEPTYRWRGQLTGAHAGGTPGNWANEEGIGICLIGDFNRTAPTAKQMNSLIKLVRFLQQRYHIPKSRIYGHRDVPGGHETECPGRRFPMSRFKAAL